MKNKLIVLDDENIESMIYEIRGKQVMLDSDLAKLYKCKNGTKSINLAVKRNINRFPDRFRFQLTNEEYKKLQFQNETANNMNRTLPYVFTEEGVAMLSAVLKTKIAEEIFFNHLGNKTFGIYKINEIEFKKLLLNKIKKL